MKEKIILVGGGGHCKACIDVIEEGNKFQIAGIIDTKKKLHQKVLNYEIIASDEDLARLVKEYKYFLITVGHIKSAEKRITLFDYLVKLGARLPVIVSPTAYVSEHAIVFAGTIIMHKVCVNAGAHIGRNCIINTGAVIEHDACIGAHCHISTKCVINGQARVGEGTFVGSNSVLINNVCIAPRSVIGAGAVIVQSLPESGVYVGRPARQVESYE